MTSSVSGSVAEYQVHINVLFVFVFDDLSEPNGLKSSKFATCRYLARPIAFSIS